MALRQRRARPARRCAGTPTGKRTRGRRPPGGPRRCPPAPPRPPRPRRAATRRGGPAHARPRSAARCARLRSSSFAPASRSSTASCWEIALGRVAERPRGAVDGAAGVDLAEQPEPVQVQHCAAKLHDSVHECAMDVNGLRCQHGSHGTAAVPPVRRRLRGDGDLRQARVRRRRRGRRPAARAVRPGGGAAARSRRCDGCAAWPAAPVGARRAGDGRDRLRDAVGAVLRRARADGRLAARADPLRLSGAGAGRRRSRSAASAHRCGGSPRCSSRSRAPRWCSRGRRPGASTALGTAMGFGAALAYTVYILTGDRVGAAVPPVALAAFVCLGATCTFALASVVRGGPELGFGADGWVWVGAIALVSTVAAILCFFAGLARVGPSAASILSTLEPLVTVGAGGGGVRGVARRGAAGRGRTGARGRAGDAVAGAPAYDVHRRRARGPGQRQLRPVRREGARGAEARVNLSAPRASGLRTLAA